MKRILSTFLCLLTALLAAGTAAAQTQTVTGTVTDPEGLPVISAGVMVQGTTQGTVTDVDGRYSLSVPADAVLVFSSIGYAEQTVPVGGRAVIDVILQEDAQMLDETIVVAFGTSTKESFTGSAKVVKADELAKSQVTAVTSALYGKVAGVQMSTTSGAAGDTPSIRIRGFSSINAGQSPLFIVDGMPVEDMNMINPQDVESMSVLKDAASNSLYGARGANGVIIITTKRSREKDAVISLDAKVGLNTRALQNYDYITNPAEYYQTHYAALKNYFVDQGNHPGEAWLLANEAMTEPGANGSLGYLVYTVPQGQALIGENGKLNPRATLGRFANHGGQDFLLLPDDWMKAGYRNSIRQEYNLSAMGGSEKMNAYASLGWLDNQGITFNSDMERLTSRLRLDWQAKPWVKLTGNMAYTGYEYNSLSNNGNSTSTGNIWAFTSRVAPIYPLYVRDASGQVMVDENGFRMMDYGDGMNAGLTRPILPNANALMANQLNTNNHKGNAYNMNGTADFTFLKYFKFTLNAALNVDEYRTTYVSNMFYGQFAPSGGSVTKSHTRTTTLNTQQLLNYTQQFGQHNLNVLVGHEYYGYDYAYLYGYKTKMFSADNLELDGALIDGQAASSQTSTYNTEGFLSRVQYDYASRIFASASFRRDGSSRFHPQHAWGSFWSVGGAWILNKEPWFPQAPWLDMLKVKASLGSQGNDSIGSFRYANLYSITTAGGELSTPEYQVGNENITWETNMNINAGLEFTLFKGRLDGSFEWFDRKTSDMLFFFSVAPSNGYSGFYDNVGDMKNYGVEFALTYHIIDRNDLRWSVDFNATRVRNRITKLHEQHKSAVVEGYGGYASGSYFYGEGLPLYTRYLKSYAGPDPETGASRWWKDITDAEGNVTGKEPTTVYSEATYYLGNNPIPELYGGLGTSFAWKGFDLSVQTSWQLGGKAYDSGYSSLMTPPGTTTGANFHKDVLKAWTPENTGSDIPRWVFGDTYAASTSDRFITDASYLNIENINIGYTFPSARVSRIGLQSLRLYGSCENVWYWSARKGFDPRGSFTGSPSTANFVPVRTVSLGITLKF